MMLVPTSLLAPTLSGDRMKRYLKQRSCEVNGKIIYKTRKKAKAAIKAVKGSGYANSKQGVFEPYQCKYCQGYHNGHRPIGWGPSKSQIRKGVYELNTSCTRILPGT